MCVLFVCLCGVVCVGNECRCVVRSVCVAAFPCGQTFVGVKCCHVGPSVSSLGPRPPLHSRVSLPAVFVLLLSSSSSRSPSPLAQFSRPSLFSTWERRSVKTALLPCLVDRCGQADLFWACEKRRRAATTTPTGSRGSSSGIKSSSSSSIKSSGDDSRSTMQQTKKIDNFTRTAATRGLDSGEQYHDRLFTRSARSSSSIESCHCFVLLEFGAYDDSDDDAHTSYGETAGP